jgi:hypothetical protein
MIGVLLCAALAASPGDHLFKKGKTAFEAGRLTEALEAFQQARQVDKAPELLLNIAQCNRGLGRRAEAITALEDFLTEAPRHPLRKAAENTLLDLRAEQAADAPHPREDVPGKVDLVPAPIEGQPVVVEPPLPVVEQRVVWPWVLGGAIIVVAAVATGVGIAVSQPGNAVAKLPDLGTLHLPPR